MRIRASANGLVVQATAGTHVVLIGMDFEEARAGELLGFSIERTNHATGKTYWVWNDILFPAHDAIAKAARDAGQKPDPALFGSDLNPFQEFLRGDYTVSPGTAYTYRVVAQGGTPEQLVPLAEASVDVTTETVEHGDGHAVWFNRAAVSSQAYVREFENKRPDEVPDRAAYIWLSRGLEEALLAFIGNAVDSTWQIRGSIYEFQYPAALDALLRAHDQGADVKVLYDDTAMKTSPAKSNEKAVAAAHIEGITGIRSVGATIKHNKFLVLSHGGKPVAVWTGSTNWTEAGLFGHANVGHSCWDPSIASHYRAYWDELATNPTGAVLKPWTIHDTPIPEEDDRSPQTGVHCLFSPRPDNSALAWYADLIRHATAGTFIAAPFGLSGSIRDVFKEHADLLRYVLVDSETTDTVALEVRDGHPENQITGGAYLPERFGQWLKEVDSQQLGITTHVVYIHTKILLINPLTDDPIVITGSANFSDNSTLHSDENMLVIRGNTRVADIYLSEYMRLFNQYRFRARLGLDPTTPGPDPTAGTTVDTTLKTTPDWAKPYYTPTDPGRFQERLLFSGQSLSA
jgi:phosphatidylserine/phosphatidylglycerophosphate/cardiolipin synthase-like enzyme